jgi:predicted RNase H-like HicB family nuclease
MDYTIVITEVEDGWFMGQCEQLPNAITQGQTIEEVEENMKEAISLILEDETCNGVSIPKHEDIKKTVADEICKRLGIPIISK